MIRVEPVNSLSLVCTDDGWSFASRHRTKIMRHWHELTATRPDLWNGDVLICTSAGVQNEHFTATLVKSDYASFIAWRDWGRPEEAGAVNCFGVPAAFSSDGALIFGVMADWTLNAGLAYPPSGSLEPKDVGAGGEVDIFGNMRTELLEEAGLDLSEAQAGAMAVIFDGPRIAVVRRYDFGYSRRDIETRFLAHAASEKRPELAGLEAISGTSQIDSRMPPYAQEIIRYFFP